MNSASRSELFFYSLIAIIVYMGANAIFSPLQFVEILNSMFFGLSGCVLIVLWPLVWRAVKTTEFDRVSQLSVGIVITWLSIMANRTVNAVAHYEDIHNNLLDSAYVSIAAYLSILGGILYITAPGMVNNEFKHNRGLLKFSIVFGLVLAFISYRAQR